MERPRSIGLLARETGVHVETIRYYERRGLLREPRRSTGRQRHYDDEARRVARIRERLERLVANCGAEGSGRECPLLAAFEDGAAA